MKERRTHYRINDLLTFTYKILDPDNAKEEIEIFERRPSEVSRMSVKYPRLMAEILDPRSTTSEEEEPYQAVLDLVANVSEKLDLLIEYILSEDKAALKSQTLSGEPKSVNISGSGMVFYTDEKLSKGDWLLIQLKLPFSIPFILRTIARVVRVSDQKTKGGFETAVHFQYIKGDDREVLIRYISIRSRGLIRNRLLR